MLARIAQQFNSSTQGYEISKQVIQDLKRQKRFQDVESLGYGEVDVMALGELLERLCDDEMRQGSVFLDIGAGTGKACLAAFAVGFKRSIGIEVMPELHALAEKTFRTLRGMEGCSDAAERIEFKLGSSLDMISDWEASNVIFLSITLFSDEDVATIEDIVETKVKPGAHVLSTTRKLKCRNLALDQSLPLRLVKGVLTVYCYRVVNPDDL